jgi:hypothetical protein
MNQITTACRCLAWLSIAALFAVLAYQAFTLPARLEADARSAETRVLAQITGLRSDLNGQVAGLRSDLTGESAAWRNTTDKRLGSIQGDVAIRLDTALVRADARLGDVTAAVAGLRADLAPTLAHAASVAQHADEASAILLRRDALPAQLLGTVAAARVTLGETAETMRDFRRATPALLTGIDHVVANSNKTTDATATVMGNFAKATKPLPTWLRITLGVAPPLAATAAGAATVYSIAH